MADCPHCWFVNPDDFFYCGSCGRPIAPPNPAGAPADAAGERKWATVLFAHLTDYAALCEAMDPEEVNAFIKPLLNEISGVARHYGATIERFFADEMLLLFGIPRAHEDDPDRALLAAQQIQQLAVDHGRRANTGTARPLAMQIGINTGLMVTGDEFIDQVRHGLTGHAVNLASRLARIARPAEILVGAQTYRAVQERFPFAPGPPVRIQASTDDVPTYRLRQPNESQPQLQPIRHRRSRLVGRESQMACLAEALAKLRNGCKVLVTVRGEAGTGKSRLLREFRNGLAQSTVQWLQGQAYSYTQETPYAPVTNLIHRLTGVTVSDSPQAARRKVAAGVNDLVGDRQEIVNYLDSLCAIPHGEWVPVSPEAWKINMQAAVVELLSSLCRRAPTVICFEDLHWADPSTLAFFETILRHMTSPAMVVFSSRPVFSSDRLDTDHLDETAVFTVHLGDLARSQSVEMLESLLAPTRVDPEALAFIVHRSQGNPFFLEEIVTGLIESRRLAVHNRRWQLFEPLPAANDLSAPIHAVIAGRLDGLPPLTKRIVQACSVIGRSFAFDVLKAVVEPVENLDDLLAELEGHDIISRVGGPQERTFTFKHGLVQEAVYTGLLRSDRRALHEKCARALERHYSDRLEWVYETLAFHYQRGMSTRKATDFLIRSAAKCYRKHALEEAHQYYERAYVLLQALDNPPREERQRLIDLLIGWFFVFNARAVFDDIVALLQRHRQTAADLDDGPRWGMYCVCLGWALQRRQRLPESHEVLTAALQIGETLKDEKIIAYANACLIWTCTDLGQLETAVSHARLARRHKDFLARDQQLLRFVMTGLGITQWFRGAADKCHEIGDILLANGERAPDPGSISEGYLVHAMGYFAAGNTSQALAHCGKAIQASVDPLYTINAKFLMGFIQLSAGDVPAADRTLKAIITATDTGGYDYISSSAKALCGVIVFAKGRFAAGIRAIKSHIQSHIDHQKIFHALTFEYLLGKLYSQMAAGGQRVPAAVILRNLPYLLVNRPGAGRQALRHLHKALDLSLSIGARGMAAQTHLALARYHADKGHHPAAAHHYRGSIALFEQCRADVLLQEARAELAELVAPPSTADKPTGTGN